MEIIGTTPSEKNYENLILSFSGGDAIYSCTEVLSFGET
jgi:hypothetical protein